MSSKKSRFNNQQPWEINNRIIIQSQSKALKVYRVNLVWQVICNSTVMIALAALDFIICKLEHRPPPTHLGCRHQ
jgi:hypothetical protein